MKNTSGKPQNDCSYADPLHSLSHKSSHKAKVGVGYLQAILEAANGPDGRDDFVAVLPRAIQPDKFVFVC